MVDVRLYQMVIDCADPRALAAWWRELLGWEERTTHDDWASIEAPGGTPRIGFQRVPEPKTVKNRVHVDLLVGPETAEAEVQRLVGLGASVVSVHDGPDGRWTLMIDPEGNEFDVS